MMISKIKKKKHCSIKIRTATIPKRTSFILLSLSLILLIIGSCTPKIVTNKESALISETAVSPKRIEVLFLGNNSTHHDSYKYAPWLAIKLFKSGINLTYTADLKDLNKENLSKYDGLIIYANHDSIAPAQEAALKEFVEGGKGLIPLHSAAGCFKNSSWYKQTIGGEFASHGTGDFKGIILKSDHPVMRGITEFETWDETYVHKSLNPDMTVLMERREGNTKEPYTWVRKQGEGRVFYTAYGHDEKTWTNLGFLDLVRNGVLWAVGDKAVAGVKAMNIPNVDIYDADTISKFTARHIVPKMQEALAPAESNKLTQVLADFDIKLFAAEPDIINPIAMAWDERGRLWIVESVDYPNTFVETDGLANDRIKICEDTDGDGVADKFTIYADKLNIPTSIVFSNGGVIVAVAPDFLFLKDTNGDDVADVRQVIMTGWEKNDTHSGPSNLQYGFDNKIWGVTGYSGFKGDINGEKLEFRQGVYNFKPNGKDFEFLAGTSNNTWGLGMTEDNNVFISTANNTHSAFYSMPEKLLKNKLPKNPDFPYISAVQKLDGHYDLHTMTPNLRQVDVVGGFTAAAGHHFYTARNFPKEYWNRMAFVTEPTVRLVHNAILEPDGAGFVEKDGWNLLASSDEWFGPVQAEVGPDGAVWIADWYNFIIQHNVFVPAQAPVEFILPFKDLPHGKGNAFSSPLRDINHGRIYRVVYKGAKTAAPLKLSKTDLPGLLNALKNDNKFWRTTAQRLIVESQNKEALTGLYEIANNLQVDEIGLNSPAVHALWTIDGLVNLNGAPTAALQVVEKALDHPAAGVRKAAVQIMPKNSNGITAIDRHGLLKDPNLNTRLATFVALALIPSSDQVGELLYNASLIKENEQDKWLSQALYSASVNHHEGFLKAAKKQGAALKGSFTERISLAIEQQFPVKKVTAVVKAPVKKVVAPKPAVKKTTNIVLRVVKDIMQYDKKLINLKAGDKVSLRFENPDGMQHNLLIIKPGTLQKVGAAADALLRNPKAADLQYVPNIPEVLFSTKILNPGESYVLEFTVPNTPGDYPFVCTFPGHWRGMNGIIRVTK
ncbi:putative membrane-bound dehydrogenase-like protein [Pedobacter sp. CG_S7]|uniref:PVC-type heme-binding CxxCH protein n=1 Tax=Pedobacter sp. CG_S7 TaxID=3143930 RepID=UPI003398CE51